MVGCKSNDMKQIIVFALSAFISFLISYGIIIFLIGCIYVPFYLWFCLSCAKAVEIKVLTLIAVPWGGMLSLCMVEGIDYEINKLLK
jgi:hypothetical protein